MGLLNAFVLRPGHRVVVVGGTSGIGHGIALRLARAQMNVTIVGRNAERAQAVLADLRAASSHLDPVPTHDFIECDVSLLGNVRGFVEQYPHERLDALVLTQGIATIQGRTETREGLDQKMSLHFYSRMAFIDGFLPLLRKSNGRVLSVLSGGVHNPYRHFQDDPELVKHYSLKNAADAAGFYNDLALDALSRQPQNSGIAFIHSGPGFINTNLGREMPFIIRALLRPIKSLGARSLQSCGDYMSDALLRDDLQPGFHLFNADGKPAKTTDAHTDEAVQVIGQHAESIIKRVTGDK